MFHQSFNFIAHTKINKRKRLKIQKSDQNVSFSILFFRLIFNQASKIPNQKMTCFFNVIQKKVSTRLFVIQFGHFSGHWLKNGQTDGVTHPPESVFSATAVSLVSLSALVPLISLSLVVQQTKVTRAMKKSLLSLLFPNCMFNGYVVLMGCSYAFSQLICKNSEPVTEPVRQIIGQLFHHHSKQAGGLCCRCSANEQMMCRQKINI